MTTPTLIMSETGAAAAAPSGRYPTPYAHDIDTLWIDWLSFHAGEVNCLYMFRELEAAFGPRIRDMTGRQITELLRAAQSDLPIKTIERFYAGADVLQTVCERRDLFFRTRPIMSFLTAQGLT